MEENKYLKIFSLCAFVAFAAVSCWATAESLHLLLPSWPALMCWIVTIGFFVIASLGTKMIVDSLNQNIYMERRGMSLIFGIILVVIFWLCCSMPTNTHTFFYRTCVGSVVMQDLSTTKSYLQRLADNTKGENEVKAKQANLEKEVNAEVIALNNEIDNMANPGFGNRAKWHLAKIATTLQVASIPELSCKGNDAQQIRLLKEQYRKLIYDQLNTRKQQIAENMQNSQEKVYKPLAAKQIKEINKIENTIIDMDTKGNVDNETVSDANIALKQGYNTIKNYSKFIQFTNDDDKAIYTADNQVTRTTRLLSVIDVWKDFLAGKYAGRGFGFWIMISILVDVAAFIFFDIAFKRRDD